MNGPAVLKSLGAQVAHALAQRGVDVVFGIPGVHNIELYRGIGDAGIRHVLPRHEQGAGFMAIGYACVTGRPGVALVISGPGLCNIMTPMGQAYSDSVPMLVLSSCLDPDDDSSGSRLHEMKDQEGAAATVCDWSATARDAGGVQKLLDRAFTEYSTSRPLPKQIQIPISNLSDLVSPIPDLDSLPGPAAVSSDDVETVAARIGRSRRPLFIFGGGARGAPAAARRVIERSGAAFFCTYAAKGIIGSSHVLGLGSALPRPESQDVVCEADLVVVIGSRLSETDLWRERLGHRCEMIRIDIDHSALADKHGADVALHGDATRFLEDLAEALPVTARRSGWDPAHLRKARSEFRASADLERPGIARVADALVDAAGDETVIFSDMTQFAYVAKETACLDVPNRWFHPSGFGTLGFALPAAIGASAAPGHRNVVAVAGDYGFQFTLQELATAVDLGIGLPVVIWDNRALKEIEDCMTAAQIEPFAVAAPGPDLELLARAYRVGYARPSSLSEFGRAVVDGFSGNLPTVIHLTPAISAS